MKKLSVWVKRYKTKNSVFYRAISKRYKGFPLGVVVGIVIVAAASVYAAPIVLDSNTTKTTQTPKHSTINSSNTSSNKPTNTAVSSNNNQPSSTTPSSTQPGNKSSSSSSSSTNTPTSTASQEPAPTLTGIEVITPTQGADQDIYIPYCEFGSITSGTPETCYNYVPISFDLVAQYSDGSTTPIAWSDASVSSPNPAGGYPPVPTLLNIDEANNTLILGTGPGYFLNDHTSDAIVQFNVTYQSWSYTKYIHIYVNSLWGTPPS